MAIYSSGSSMPDNSIVYIFELNRIYNLGLEEEIHRHFHSNGNNSIFVNNGCFSQIRLGNKKYSFNSDSKLYEGYFIYVGKCCATLHGLCIFLKSQDRVFLWEDKILK